MKNYARVEDSVGRTVFNKVSGTDGEAIHISGSLTLGGDQDQHSKKQLRTYAGLLSGAPAVAVGLQQCGRMCWQIL